MSARITIVRLFVALVGLFLCFVGVLHDFINIRSLQRALARGEITERLGPQLVANVAFAGAALSVLGVILLFAAHDLRAPHRGVWRVSVLVGVFLVIAGVAGYLWLPRMSVLLFSGLGALVAIPLLVWRRDFTSS